MTPIQMALIRAGVKNLHEFGYPDCTEANILTDRVYSRFFKSMLESNRGLDRRADVHIKALLRTLEQPQAADAVARSDGDG
jgi:hypothetical protein